MNDKTLNPLPLFARALRFGGRFNRVQFAINSFGSLVLLAVILIKFGDALFEPGRGAGTLPTAAYAVAASLLLVMLVFLGSAIRRLHDLGHSDWLIVALFIATSIPCLNVILFVYLLATPGNPGAVMSPRRISSVLLALLAMGNAIAFAIVTVTSIPGLLRKRMAANEAATLGDIRAVLFAQLTYQSMNGGYYERRTECLSSPADCIQGASAHPAVDAPTLLSPTRGYIRELVGGADVPELNPGLSRTSTSSYALVAHPIKVGQTGLRSFCGDHTGRICFGAGPGPALVERTASGVQCSKTCQTLE